MNTSKVINLYDRRRNTLCKQQGLTANPLYLFRNGAKEWGATIRTFLSRGKEMVIWCPLDRSVSYVSSFWELFLRMAECMDAQTGRSFAKGRPKSTAEISRLMRRFFERAELLEPLTILFAEFQTLADSPVRKLLREWQQHPASDTIIILIEESETSIGKEGHTRRIPHTSPECAIPFREAQVFYAKQGIVLGERFMNPETMIPSTYFSWLEDYLQTTG